MNAIIPLMIVLVLGGISGYLLHRRTPHWWRASLIAAAIATVVWLLGIYLFLWIAAPSELGPPLLGIVAQTYVLALVPAYFSGFLKSDDTSNIPSTD